MLTPPKLARILEITNELETILEDAEYTELMTISGDAAYMRPYLVKQLACLKYDVYKILNKNLTFPPKGVTLGKEEENKV